MEKPKLVLGNLLGPEGNAFVMLGRAKQVAEANLMDGEWGAINQEATSGDYEHLIKTLDKYFDCEYTR